MKCILSLIMLLLISGSARTQLSQEWIRTHNGPMNGNDEALTHATDASGNIYAAGKMHVSGTQFDIYTAKYNSSGNIIWETAYNGEGSGNDIAYSIAVDNSGNVFVAGESRGTGTFNDMVLLKYDNAGSLMWARRYNGSANNMDIARRVVADASGNATITGISSETPSSLDIVTIKYNSLGDVIWLSRYNGPSNSNDMVDDMKSDNSGNIFISGSTFESGNINDFILIKYSSSGDELWVRKYNGPANGNDNLTSLATDITGNVIITGSSVGTGTGIDIATLKYSSSGDQIWLRRYTGKLNSGIDEPKAIATDYQGNVFVIAASVGQSTSYDYLTVKYSSGGDELWTRRYNGPSSINFDEPRSVAVDAYGNAYVSGLSAGQGTMDDIVTVKYATNGDELWLNRFNTSSNRNDVANKISVDNAGSLVVSGFVTGAATQSDFAVIKFSQLTTVNQFSASAPSSFYLEQNYPNPFNPSTIIRYSVAEDSPVKLTVFDLIGREVAVIDEGYRKAGEYTAQFKTDDIEPAKKLSGGVYFYRLEAGKHAVTKSMVLLK